MVTEAFQFSWQERTSCSVTFQLNALKTLFLVFHNTILRATGQNISFYVKLLTSLVCGLNQCEISLPALAMIGLNRTSPVENKRTVPQQVHCSFIPPFKQVGKGEGLAIYLIGQLNFNSTFWLAQLTSLIQSNYAVENCVCDLKRIKSDRISITLVTGSVGVVTLPTWVFLAELREIVHLAQVGDPAISLRVMGSHLARSVVGRPRHNIFCASPSSIAIATAHVGINFN